MPLNLILDQAEAVVIGSVTSSSIVNDVWTATLTIDRGLKGQLIPGNNVRVTWPLTTPLRLSGQMARKDLLVGVTGMWFLKHSDTGWLLLSWISGAADLSDTYIPAVKRDLPYDLSYAENTDVRKKLLLELEAATLNPTTSGPLSQMWSKLYLDNLGKDVVEPLYQRLAASPDPNLMILGLIGNTGLGIPGAVITVAALNPNLLDSTRQGSLAGALCRYRSTDVSGVFALGELLTSQYSNAVKTCAVYALREIHTKDAIPFLQNLLVSKTAKYRYDAVIGIAQFAMSFPAAKIGEKQTAMADFRVSANVSPELAKNYPAIDIFEKNEEQYILYWTQWLHSHLAQ